MKNIVRVIAYIKNYWVYILLNFVSNFLYSFFSLFTISMIVPFLQVLFEVKPQITEMPAISLSNIVDIFYYYMHVVIENNGKFSAMIYVTLVMVACSLCSNFFRFMGKFFVIPMQNGVSKDIRNDIYKRTLILPLSYYSKQRSGDILARVTLDIDEIQIAMQDLVQFLFRDPIMIIIYLGTLFYISVQLTLLSLVIVPVIILFISYIGKSIRSKANKGQKEIGFLSALYEETISGLRIIKAFNVQRIFAERFKIHNAKFTKLSKKVQRKNELASPLTEVLGILTIVFIILIGSQMVAKKNITGFELLGFVVIFARIISPAQALANAAFSIRKGMASADRVFQVIDADEKIVEKPNPIRLTQFEDKIEFKNVCFSYEATPILKDINLTVNKGETIAIVGPSGAGKTTLVDLLPRFYDCEGELLIDGKDIKDCCITDVRQLMGMVNQDVILFNDTIFNNIAYGKPGATMEEVQHAAQIANAHDFIMQMPEAYQTEIGDRGTRLSGGQRQRVSIARAVLKNPPVLILDEATSALDTESEHLVQEALTNLMQNRTTFVIAHRLSTIQHAHHIVVLDQGTIMESGTHEELIAANGIYKKLLDAQQFS